MIKFRLPFGRARRLKEKLKASDEAQLTLVDLGIVSATSPQVRRIEVEVASPTKIRSCLDGLHVEPDELPSAGRYQLNLRLDPAFLIPNALIEACLIMETSGEERLVRVTGSVDDCSLGSTKTSTTIVERPWALVHKLAGHSHKVRAVAFALEGRILISGGDDCTIRWWDPLRGEEIDSGQKFGSEVRCLAASRDGRLVAVGLRDGTICIQEAFTRRTLWSRQVHQGYIAGLCFSPDSSLLAAGSGDRSLSVIDTWSGSLLYEPIRPEGKKAGVVTSIALSGNGLVLASASQIGNRIMLWELRTGEMLRELVGHKGTVWTLAFSLDGYLLASGSGDRTVRLWDTQTAQTIRVLEGFRGDVFCVAVSPDGKLVATASAEPKVRVWHIGSGRRLANVESGDQWLRHLTFSPT